MNKLGFFAAFAFTAVLCVGCATSEKPRSSSTLMSSQQKEEVTKDPVQKQIDDRVDEIQKERRSKFRLNSLMRR